MAARGHHGARRKAGRGSLSASASLAKQRRVALQTRLGATPDNLATLTLTHHADEHGIAAPARWEDVWRQSKLHLRTPSSDRGSRKKSRLPMSRNEQAASDSQGSSVFSPVSGNRLEIYSGVPMRYAVTSCDFSEHARQVWEVDRAPVLEWTGRAASASPRAAISTARRDPHRTAQAGRPFCSCPPGRIARAALPASEGDGRSGASGLGLGSPCRKEQHRNGTPSSPTCCRPWPVVTRDDRRGLAADHPCRAACHRGGHGN